MRRALFAACLVAALAACGGGQSSASASPPPPPPPAGGSVLATWTPSPEVDLAGYRVYWGTSPRQYNQARGAGLDAGQRTSMLLSGLPSGTIYVAVTAYDASGNESAYSAEVAK